jgi:glyceraldehyde 3-phosphate dehydrogenase
MRVAINGFGRIGRSVFRILDQNKDIEVIAINDLSNQESLAYLLKYDTIMGRFSGNVNIEKDILHTDNESVQMLSERDPAKLPWEDLSIDIVIESTGVFRSCSALETHLKAGAKKVILTVPAKDKIDNTVVIGVNEDTLKKEHRIVSNASCTTNCLAPMAKILDESFGIKQGVMNTVHAYTNDQRLADVPHSDLRRSRAAAENIIPTSTGAARAVGMVLPELNGKLDGIASRVPVPDGSVVDLFIELEKEVTVQDIHDAVKVAAETERMKNILYYYKC